MPSQVRGASPPVRAPLLARRDWGQLIVCTTRIPRRLDPFIVPTIDAHHLVLLGAGVLELDRRGLGTALRRGHMSAGDVHVTAAGAPAYELGWREPPRELRATHVLLDGQLVARVEQEHRAGAAGASEPVAVVRSSLTAELMRELGRVLDSPHATDDLYGEIVAELLAVHLARTRARRWDGTAPRGALSPRAVRRVHDYVWAHLDGAIRLADLAREAGLSRYHFTRAFKAATGSSPHVFVRACRIEAATRLLRETPASIAEVALATGFSSQSHFITRFRLATGTTPAVFRKQN